MKMNTIDGRIALLREKMSERGIDMYYVPTSDFHETEYVCDYFKCRRYITGFTGSAGVAVIGRDFAGLWTDGRYYIQAAGEIAGSCVELFRDGSDGVLHVDAFLADKAQDGMVIGFDGRVVNMQFIDGLKAKLGDKKVGFVYDVDLVGDIWSDRPSLPAKPVWIMEEKYSGRSTADKLAAVREEMNKAGADMHIISVLDNINWLFNIRGGDIENFPVVLSYAVIEADKAVLFVNPKTISSEVEKRLLADGIVIMPYDDIYDYVKTHKTCRVLLDKHKVNYRLFCSVPSGCEIIDRPNPCVIMQAIKNDTEIENIKAAHVKDGIAVTKFICWLKKNVGKMEMDEVSAADYLERCRREQGIFDLSFETICAYGSNAAMMHYSATPECFSKIEPEGFLLVDSGGHYPEGSTDITRTIVLGPVTQEMKKMYTLVLKGHMALADAHFLHGCTGINLDILARGPLWDLGIDYRCGTGHGVGYCLNIHEAPNGFRWRKVPERNDGCVLEAGMVTTDEPGYYEEGAYGIRIENELVCREGIKTEYGQFMEFENITYAPIDLDAVDVSLLSAADIDRINRYHDMVFSVLSPYFSGEELEFLKHETRHISSSEK